MSDCGVCISGDPDWTAVEIDDQRVTNTEDHKCCECGRKIDAGTECARAILYQSYGDDGQPAEPSTYWTCLICDEIADAFFCGGRVWGGSLWEYFDEGDVWAGLTTSCFDKLSTPQAKAELRTRWMDWKGL